MANAAAAGVSANCRNPNFGAADQGAFQRLPGPVCRERNRSRHRRRGEANAVSEAEPQTPGVRQQLPAQPRLNRRELAGQGYPEILYGALGFRARHAASHKFADRLRNVHAMYECAPKDGFDGVVTGFLQQQGQECGGVHGVPGGRLRVHEGSSRAASARRSWINSSDSSRSVGT